jgi:rhamnosyl/mannosyltransferase
VKVLHVYKDYAPVLGGIENHLRLLATRQARAGLEVTVLVAHPGRRTTIGDEEGVRVIRAARLGTVASTPISPSLVAWLRRLSTDVLHLHAPHPPGELAAPLCRPRSTVLTYHSDIVRQRVLGRLYRPLQRRMLKRVDRILVTSPRYLETSRTLAPHADRCRVVPLGIDPAPFLEPDAEVMAEARARYGDRAVLFVGRLRYYKGIQHLIAAMKEVEGSLIVAGDGPMESEWRELGRRLLPGRCHFLGAVSTIELAALYGAAAVAVLPSVERSEAFGVALVEAMAAGLPVVSTELGTGTSWVNQDGVTGLVVRAGDPAALATAIRDLLAAPERRRLLGQAGRRRVLAELDAERMTSRVIAIYDEALAARSV